MDLYIEKDAAINEEIDRLRLASTKAVLTRRDVLIVASVSCIYNIGSPQAYRQSTLTLYKNQILPIEQIKEQLVRLQYERSDLDLKRATFRVKGDILEIYPAYEELNHCMQIVLLLLQYNLCFLVIFVLLAECILGFFWL